MKKIFLKKYRSVKSVNSSQSLTTRLTSSQRLLPPSKLFETINNHNLYNQERKDSNIIRLNCTVNTYCSNILFNLHTEIIKDEGSKDCMCLTKNPRESGFILENKLRYKNVDDFIDTSLNPDNVLISFFRHNVNKKIVHFLSIFIDFFFTNLKVFYIIPLRRNL